MDIDQTRSIVCKILGISRLTEQSFARLGHIKTPINHRKSLAYLYSNYHLQDLGISIKTRSIIHKTWVCHRVLVWYIIHHTALVHRLLYRRGRVLDFRSKGPGFDPYTGHGDNLGVRDRTWCIRTLIIHSQDLGMSRLRSIVHKTWAYQDSNKSSQVIGIFVLRLIICKTWTYKLRHDQSFARLGLIKIPINHSQDFGISRLRSIVHKTWAYQDSGQSFARLGHIQTYAHYELDMPVLLMIHQSFLND